jgi:hypothetical protein
MADWQPIETVPKDNKPIYVIQYNPDWPESLYHVSTVIWHGYADGFGSWWREDRNDIDEPTHWMPVKPPA